MAMEIELAGVSVRSRRRMFTNADRSIFLELTNEVTEFEEQKKKYSNASPDQLWTTPPVQGIVQHNDESSQRKNSIYPKSGKMAVSQDSGALKSRFEDEPPSLNGSKVAGLSKSRENVNLPNDESKSVEIQKNVNDGPSELANTTHDERKESKSPDTSTDNHIKISNNTEEAGMKILQGAAKINVTPHRMVVSGSIPSTSTLRSNRRAIKLTNISKLNNIAQMTNFNHAAAASSSSSSDANTGTLLPISPTLRESAPNTSTSESKPKGSWVAARESGFGKKEDSDRHSMFPSFLSVGYRGQGIDERRKVIDEVYSSERSYLASLHLCVLEYKRPSGGEKAPFTDEESKKIFSNIEVIRNFTRDLVESLCNRIEDWNPNQVICDIFLKVWPFFKVYSEYCGNYDFSRETIKSASERSEVANWLSRKLKELGGKTLDSLLIQPVQRIPRYRLLFSDLKKKTPPNHPDYQNCTELANQFAKLACALDQSISKAIRSRQFAGIWKKIKKNESLVAPHRQFVSEISCWMGNEERTVLLFNDILTITKRSNPPNSNANATTTNATINNEAEDEEYEVCDIYPLELLWILDDPNIISHLQHVEKSPSSPYSDLNRDVSPATHSRTTVNNVNNNVNIIPGSLDTSLLRNSAEVASSGENESTGMSAGREGWSPSTRRKGIQSSTGSRVRVGNRLELSSESSALSASFPVASSMPNPVSFLTASLPAATSSVSLPTNRTNAAALNSVLSASPSNSSTSSTSPPSIYLDLSTIALQFERLNLSPRRDGSKPCSPAVSPREMAGSRDFYKEIKEYKESKEKSHKEKTQEKEKSKERDKERTRDKEKEDERKILSLNRHLNDAATLNLLNPDEIIHLRFPDVKIKNEFARELDQNIMEWIGRIDKKEVTNKETRYGAHTFVNGASWMGYWLIGSMCGSGKFTFPNGDTYEGTVFKGQREGKGKFTYRGIYSYDGTWKDDEFDGLGVITYTIGNYVETYEGNFLKGKKHGEGKMVWMNGDSYEGHWVEDKMDGNGKFKSSRGFEYEGHWRKNTRHGYGSQVSSTGVTFKGNFYMNQRQGKGSETYPDRTSSLDIMFDKNVPVGIASKPIPTHSSHSDEIEEGSLATPDYSYYTGQLLDGLPHGQGKLVQVNGVTYEGKFEKGYKHGHGSLTDPNFIIYEGGWVSNQMYGKGKLKSPIGVFTGEWRNNLAEGYGEMVLVEGTTLTGYWNDGILENKNSAIKENYYYSSGEDNLKDNIKLSLAGKNFVLPAPMTLYFD